MRLAAYIIVVLLMGCSGKKPARQLPPVDGNTGADATQLSEEINRLKGEFASGEKNSAELAKLRHELRQSKLAMDELAQQGQQTAELQTTIDALQGQLDAQQARINEGNAAHQEKIDALTTRIAALQAEVKTKARDNAELSTDIEALKKDLEQLEASGAEVAALREAIEALEQGGAEEAQPSQPAATNPATATQPVANPPVARTTAATETESTAEPAAESGTEPEITCRESICTYLLLTREGKRMQLVVVTGDEAGDTALKSASYTYPNYIEVEFTLNGSTKCVELKFNEEHLASALLRNLQASVLDITGGDECQ